MVAIDARHVRRGPAEGERAVVDDVIHLVQGMLDRVTVSVLMSTMRRERKDYTRRGEGKGRGGERE